MTWHDNIAEEYYGIELVKGEESYQFSSYYLLTMIQQYVQAEAKFIRSKNFQTIEGSLYTQFNGSYKLSKYQAWLVLDEYVKQNQLDQKIYQFNPVIINCGGQQINIFNPSYHFLLQKIKENNIPDEKIIKMIRLLLIGFEPKNKELPPHEQSEYVHEYLEEMPVTLPALVVTLFGSEVSRNPMSIIPSLMLLDLIESNAVLSFNELPITLKTCLPQSTNPQVIIIEWLMRYWKNSTEKKISLNRLSKLQFEQKQKESNINQPSELRFYTYKIMEMMSKVLELQLPKNKLLFYASESDSTEICTLFDSTRIYSFDSFCSESSIEEIKQDMPRLTC
jgi:hypothetical protein